MIIKTCVFKFKGVFFVFPSSIVLIIFEYLLCPSFNLSNLTFDWKANYFYTEPNPFVSGPHREWLFKSFSLSSHSERSKNYAICPTRVPLGLAHHEYKSLYLLCFANTHSSSILALFKETWGQFSCHLHKALWFHLSSQGSSGDN